MRAGSPAAWLVLYLALDFANPLMPGAVTFAGGGVESVQGERARDGAGLAAVPVLPPARPEAVAALAAPPARLQPARRRRRAVRRLPPREPGPAPPADDH